MTQISTLPLHDVPFAWPRRFSPVALFALWSIPGVAALSYYYLNQTATAQPISWSYALVSTLPNWYFWAAFTPLIVWAGKRFKITATGWLFRILTVHIPIMLLLLLLHSLLNLLLFHVTDMPGHASMSSTLFGVHFNARLVSNVVAYWAVLGVYYGYDHYRNLRIREQQAAQLEVKLVEANLRALKMQLHPHFLFNTLNSISALVRKNENKTAIRMLAQLGDFLRLALENKGVQEIPLRHELDFLERYLDIEKIRFQERLEINVQADAEVLEAFVPNMILQPLVENAIHHGIAPQAEGGTIAIRAKKVGDHLHMVVQDNGTGIKPPRQGKRKGVGLTNVQNRLENLYNKDAVFELNNVPEGGLRAEITIPFYLNPVLEKKNALSWPYVH